MAEPLEDEYNSASDEDFRPETNDVQHDQDELSSSESEAESKQTQPKKRKSIPTGDAADLGFDNSGDEATITRGRKKRRPSLDDDVGGEGGLVKTRAQRRLEEEERKPLARIDGATVDVDALWANMNTKSGSAEHRNDVPRDSGDGTNPSTPPPTQSEKIPPAHAGNEAGNSISDRDSTDSQQTSTAYTNGQETITIKRTYEFAGELITEERNVPKDSAEARLYLESLSQSPKLPTTPQSGKPPLRRPKKRPSMFEPNPTGTVAGLPPSASKGPKLNTIEKSKLDWAGYVDKEGLADELTEHKKGKEGYLGRMEFLSRVEAKREEEVKGVKR